MTPFKCAHVESGRHRLPRCKTQCVHCGILWPSEKESDANVDVPKGCWWEREICPKS